MKADLTRILAIDDEPDNLLLIRQALRQLVHTRSETETDPVQAVVRCQAEDFDLALLTIQKTSAANPTTAFR